MVKVLALVGGLAGAAALSQFPEFSQQYLQRLGGQVDALAKVVADFDASAAKAGLTRIEALDQLQGTEFLELRRADMEGSFARYARLTSDLITLRNTGPLERLAMPWRFSDVETAQAVMADFRPALPLTLEGGVSAGAGFLGGWAGLSALVSLILWPFRRFRAGSGQSPA